MSAPLLVVHHSPSPPVHALVAAITEALRIPELAEVDTEVVPALAATSDHVLRAGGLVFVSPANFGYMSGALKHFFDTTYYTCLEAVTGRPYGLVVHGNDDTTGARASVERIATSWGLTQAVGTVEVSGAVDAAAREAAAEAACTVAAHLLD